MSRYNNEFDEDDDGEELEITDEEEAASDDEGREAAALLMAHCESVAGNRKVHEDQRRMWFRLAKKALAEGADRREAAEAEEEDRREADRHEEEARIAREEEERHDRELVEREERRAEIRWRNAEAARIEAEAARARAAARPVVPTEPARPAVQRSTVLVAQPRPIAAPIPRPPKQAAARPLVVPVIAATQPSRSPPPPTSATTITLKVPERTNRVRTPTAALARYPAAQPPVTVPTAPVPTPRPTRPGPRAQARPGVGEQLLSGHDLVRWRGQQGITQRAAAERLGVAPSTVAKAELAPSKQLGEQLQAALRAALAR